MVFVGVPPPIRLIAGNNLAGYPEFVHLFLEDLAEQGVMNADALVGDLGVQSGWCNKEEHGRIVLGQMS